MRINREPQRSAGISIPDRHRRFFLRLLDSELNHRDASRQEIRSSCCRHLPGFCPSVTGHLFLSAALSSCCPFRRSSFPIMYVLLLTRVTRVHFPTTSEMPEHVFYIIKLITPSAISEAPEKFRLNLQKSPPITPYRSKIQPNASTKSTRPRY